MGAVLERSDAEAERQIRARYEGEIADEILAEGESEQIVMRIWAPLSVAELFYEVLAAYSEPYEAPARGFERMLLDVRAYWADVPRHPNPIHARDGWRCRVPACSARRNLQEHHIVFRSRGGDDELGNRVSICPWHHLRGIHGDGVMCAEGDAEGVIRWELGLRADGRPLMTMDDEVYVRA
jgi:hypothetical protein